MTEDVPGYRVLKRVGEGGFSVVYLAYQERLDRQVALKVLSVDAIDEASMHRFQRECKITGRLTGHPNVVTVLDNGTTRSGRPYITMEYFEHGSLTDRLQREGPLPVADVLRIGVKLAGALAATHESDVLHRDVKPQNILVSRYGEPALADFGVARLVDSLDSTHTNAFTPHHAAPEILEGKPPGAASDIYSLGSSLYQLLAGQPAFKGPLGEGLATLIVRILGDPPPPISREGLPQPVFDVIETAMAKLPENRFPSAVAFAQRLQQVQSELGLPVTELPYAGGPAARPAPAPGVPDGGFAIPTDGPWMPARPEPEAFAPSPDPARPLDDAPAPTPAGAEAAAATHPAPVYGPADDMAGPVDTPPAAPPTQPPAPVWTPAPVLAPAPVWTPAPGVGAHPGPGTDHGHAAPIPGPPVAPIPRPSAAPFAGSPVAPSGSDGPSRGLLVAGATALTGGLAIGVTGIVIFTGGSGGDPRPTSSPGASSSAPASPPDDGGQATPPPVAPRLTAQQIRAATPRGLRIVSVGNSARLTWALPPSARRLPIIIQRAPAGTRPVNSAGTGAMAATVGRLRAETRYCFRVGALLAPGNPPTIGWSAYRCVTTR
ncbi:serine/threonine-protein kinase [Actinomadura sp. HBU206391]|uniref:serine/threonine-protein kinase n=1 Tax=Actinomadura sp. HBU206391 TaxID=2731692 RepID=UPI0016504E76|nr:serine/threonine-protein kinase [Actinomadura sp. HBU206391]MBC6459499.1 protein kinase [Actinomadura sp. HBU206391]